MVSEEVDHEIELWTPVNPTQAEVVITVVLVAEAPAHITVTGSVVVVVD